jgi:hypothetical protein
VEAGCGASRFIGWVMLISSVGSAQPLSSAATSTSAAIINPLFFMVSSSLWLNGLMFGRMAMGFGSREQIAIKHNVTVKYITVG